MYDKKIDVRNCDRSQSIKNLTNEMNVLSIDGTKDEGDDTKNISKNVTSNDHVTDNKLLENGLENHNNDGYNDDDQHSNTEESYQNTNDSVSNKTKSKTGNKLIRSNALRTASVSPLPSEDKAKSSNQEAESKPEETKLSKEKNTDTLEFLLGLKTKDRLFVLGIENIILLHYSRASIEQKKAEEDKTKDSPPPLFSSPPLVIIQVDGFKRLLIHRICDYYELDRNVEEQYRVIIYNNSIELADLFQKKQLKEHFEDKRKQDEILNIGEGTVFSRKVLKRNSSSNTTGSMDNSSGIGSIANGNPTTGSGSSNSTSFESNVEMISSSNGANAVTTITTAVATITSSTGFMPAKTRSLEEKEQHYEKVRSKIFQQDDNRKTLPNDNPGRGNVFDSRRSSQTNQIEKNYQKSSLKQGMNQQQSNGSLGRRFTGKPSNYKNFSPTSSASLSCPRNRFSQQFKNQKVILKNGQHNSQRHYQFANQYPVQQNQTQYVQHLGQTNSYIQTHNNGAFPSTQALLPVPMQFQAGQTAILDQNSHFSHAQAQQTYQQAMVYNSIPQPQLHRPANQRRHQSAQIPVHALQAAQTHSISRSMYNYSHSQVLNNGILQQATPLGLGTQPQLPPQSSQSASQHSQHQHSFVPGLSSCVTLPTPSTSTSTNSNVPNTNQLPTAIYYPMHYSTLQTVPFASLPGLQPVTSGHVSQMNRDLTGNSSAGFGNLDEQNFFGQTQFQNFY